MARVIACASCQRQLSLPPDVPAGKQIRCPSCQAIMVVPPNAGGVRPVVLSGQQANPGFAQAAKPQKADALSKPLAAAQPRPPARPVPASSPEPVEQDEPRQRPKKKKKKAKQDSGSNRTMLFVILGSLLMTGTIVTLIIMFVPFGKIMAGTPEAQVVDVYTAINAMGYNNIGVRVMNSDTTSYCIPGPRKIMVTRPNPNGQYLQLRVKVPYADVAAYYAGAKGRNYLFKGHMQVEANGETKDVMYIQDENAATGYFQLDYQPPKHEGSTATLRDYIGPKPDDGWTCPGDTREYAEGLIFASSKDMQVKISVGDRRQDSGGGNILEGFTGKKILGNRQALIGGVAGYVFVDWNVGSAGYIVNYELEEPNTIGTNWTVQGIVELPKNAGNEVTLKVFGKPRKLKIR